MRPEKQLLLNEIKEKIDASTSLVITSYGKLEPNLSWKLRDQLAKEGGTYEVVRKRLLLKALQEAGISIELDALKGHIGVLFVKQSDPMPAAKMVFKFSEENAGLLQVLCGQMEGKMVPGAELEMLSKLPGLNEMRAILIGLLTSPMSYTLSVIEAAIEAKAPAQEQTS